jgi:predicted nicotinamide N-methyase
VPPDLFERRVAAFIRENLPLRPVPFIPEIRLHKAVPSSRLNRLAETDENFGSPYWAHYWGGGLALARYLIDHPALVAGRQLADLGAGNAIVAIAAALAGAARVTAVDIDPYALIAARLNAAANQVRIETILGDLSLRDGTDVLTVGDLFYDSDTAARVLTLARQRADAGALILIGDPIRSHLPVGELTEIARYDVSELTGAPGAGARAACVYRLRPRGA